MTNLAGKRILIVDDNIHSLDILERILEQNDMSVVRQIGGKGVIATIQESVINETPFDLCLMDIMMPDMNGYQVAQQIRALDPPISNLPLLGFSSSSTKRSKQYRALGFDGFLPKPVQSQKLLRMIERLLLPGKTGVGEDKERSEELVTQHSLIENAKHSVHILLAEDNPINRKLAFYMLTKAGYRLDIAEDGKEAVERYRSDPGKFDLIFMDVQMPEMDGREATKKIREIENSRTGAQKEALRPIPIIAMTAESMKGDVERCLEAGMNDYISKPVRRENVFKMIKKWVIKVK